MIERGRIGANKRIPVISSRIYTCLTTDVESVGWAWDSGSVVAESVSVRDVSEASGMAVRLCTECTELDTPGRTTDA
jgi:hypothetical protein